MANQYAINCTRRKEFEVADELRGIGLHPWVPVALVSKYVKERREAVWYDRPYVHKLIFCAFPAVYFRDVCEIRHVIGKPTPLSLLDVRGTPAHIGPGGKQIPARPGLDTFKAAVEAEYADAERLRANADYVCSHRPGDALELLAGKFEGMPAVFRESVKRAHDEYAKLRVGVQIMGREVIVEVDPDKVKVG